jgi:hypothetical protein
VRFCLSEAGALLLTLSLVSSCGELPRDPERTTNLIREKGEIRLGMVAGVPPQAAAEREIAATAAHLGARVTRTHGPGELLLAQLERGELDLVYGTFAANSPWSKHVHLGRPPDWRVKPPKDREAPRFAYRLGENGWIMTMERVKP